MEPLMALAIGVALVAAFTLVGYLVARRRADAGLMARLPPAAFPAAFIMPEDVPSDIQVGLQHAIEFHNQALGRRVYADLGGITEGLTISLVMERGDFYARSTFRPESDYATLRVNPAAVADDPSKLVRALAHELGHFEGLAHDTHLRSSVMFPRVITGDYELTAKDIDLVKERIWPS